MIHKTIRFLSMLLVLSSYALASEGILIVADKDDEMPALRRVFTANEQAVKQVGQNRLETDSLQKYDAVVVYIHEPILEPVETAMIRYTEDGGRLIVVHHALASAKMRNPRWLRFLGIALFPRKDPKHPWTVSAEATFDLVNLAPKHFITSNKIEYPKQVSYRSEGGNIFGDRFPAFTMSDTEIFHNQRHVDNDKTLLLAYKMTGDRAETLPKSVPAFEESAAWLKPSGKGWIVYFQPGHSPKDFEHPIFSRLLLNAAEWEPAKMHEKSEIAPLPNFVVGNPF